jgi:hypothetical protein
MSLGWKAACGLPVPAYSPRGLGRLPCCDRASTKRAAPRGQGALVMRGHLGRAPCCCAMGLAWSARVCETRSSLCAETVMRNFVRA